jgi:predicted ATPase
MRVPDAAITNLQRCEVSHLQRKSSYSALIRTGMIIALPQERPWARHQEALSWELLAATSLARLWHHNAKTAEANELLSAVYNRFTEGFHTADLRNARALIEEFRMASASR